MLPNDQSSRGDRIDEAIAKYLEAIERGEALDPEIFLAQDPEIAAELKSFIENHAQFLRLAGKLQASRSDKPKSDSSKAKTGTKEASGEKSDPNEPTLTIPARGARSSLGVLRYFGDYELVEEIARGGMGVVFKARQVTLNRIVAVKMILAGNFAGPQEVERFHTEAEAAAQLDHPGIVPIYEVGEHDGQHYFSMGFVDGESLAKRVAEGPLKPGVAATIVHAVAEALQYAHDRGVIHRDLKPGNILLDKEGNPRITDFGLAKLTESGSDLTGTGQVLGTPSYMPPEQAAAQVSAVGRLSDVYSLGAVLYCLLTGRPPFQAASPIETLFQVQRQDPVPPRQLNPGIPLDLDTIVLKCLDKSPNRRYVSSKALADELNRYLSGRPIEARPVGRIERLWRWCRREPVVSSLSAAVIMALIIGAGVSTYFAIMNGQLAKRNGDLADEKGKLATKNAELAESQKELTKLEQAATQEATEALAEQKRQTELALSAEQREREAKEQERQAKEVAEARRIETEFNARLIKRHSYLEHMNLIQSAWNDGRIKTVLDLLDRHRPKAGEEDLRDFEWYYWDRMCHREQQAIALNSEFVVFSPDTTEFVALDNRKARIWNVRSLAPKLLLFGHTDQIKHAAYSSDGTRIATSGQDSLVKLWDSATGAEVLSFKAHLRPVLKVALNSSGARIVSTDGYLAKVWDGATGQEAIVLEGQEAVISDTPNQSERISIDAVAISPDGQRIAAGYSNGSIKLWDAATGKPLLLAGHEGRILSIAISTEGNWLASSSQDNSVKLWDIRSGAGVLSRILREDADGVACIAFNGSETQLVGGSQDGSLKVWDLASGQTLRTIKGNVESVASVSFSRDGNSIGSFCPTDRQVKIWDAAHPFEFRSFTGWTGPVDDLTFTGDGQQVATWTKSEIVSGNNSSSTPIRGKGVPNAEITFWNVASGIAGESLRGLPGPVKSLAFHPDGLSFAITSGDATIRIFDVSARALKRKLIAWAPVNELAYSPSGNWIAAACNDGTVQLWEADTGVSTTWDVALTEPMKTFVAASSTPSRQERLSGFTPPRSVEESRKTINAVTFSRNERIASITGGGAISVCSPDEDKPLIFDTLTFVDANRFGLAVVNERSDPGARTGGGFGGRGGGIAGGNGGFDGGMMNRKTEPSVVDVRKLPFAFSPDANQIAMVTYVKPLILNAATGKRTHVLEGHTANVSAIAYNARGTRIASASEDGEIRIWDSMTGEHTLTLKVNKSDAVRWNSNSNPKVASRISAIAFSPDNSRIACNWDGQGIRIWDAIETGTTLANAIQEQATERNWREVRRTLELAIEARPRDAINYILLGTVQIFQEDQAAFRKLFSKLDHDFYATSNMDDRDSLLTLFALAQEQMPDLQIPTALIDSIDQDLTRSSPGIRGAWCHISGSLVDLRKGRIGPAKGLVQQALEECKDTDLECCAQLVLGLVHAAASEKALAMDAFVAALDLLLSDTAHGPAVDLTNRRLRLQRQSDTANWLADALTPRGWKTWLTTQILSQQMERQLFGRLLSIEEKSAILKQRQVAAAPPRPKSIIVVSVPTALGSTTTAGPGWGGRVPLSAAPTAASLWDFTWESMPEATEYHVVVVNSNHQDQEPIVNLKTSSRSRILHQKPTSTTIQDDALSWKVRARVHGNWTSWSEEFRFELPKLPASSPKTKLGAEFKALSDAVKLNPMDVGALYNRAVILTLLSQDQYTEMIRGNTNNRFGGGGQTRKNPLDLAIEDYTEAIRLDPEFSVAYFGRGMVWEKLGRFDDALADFNNAIRLNSEFGAAYKYRGMTLNSKKEYERSARDWMSAIEFDPHDHKTLNLLAWLRATCPDPELRNGKQAIHDAMLACRLSNWKNSNYLNTLAASFAEVGDFDPAVRWQAEAIKLRWSIPESNFEQAVLFEIKSGQRRGEAMQELMDRLELYRSGRPYHDAP